MKEKGFTLIELLAVIVILAIIALIAVPIILNIIKDSKKASDERSIELYGKAVEQAVAKEQLNGNNIEPGDLKEEFISKVEYKGSRVKCETSKLNTNGTVYLANCKVDGKDVDYTYGTKEIIQVFKPQYYSWNLSGTVGTTNAPAEADRSTTPPTGKDYYLGYDVSNDKVSAAYACFKRNGIEYCLKGLDKSVYDKNVEILNDAYADVENACSLVHEDYICRDGSLTAHALSYSPWDVAATGGSGSCYVSGSGTFRCYE